MNSDKLQVLQKKTFISRLKTYFFTGIAVTAPLGITFYLSFIFINFINDKEKKLIPDKYIPDTYLLFEVPGLGLIIAMLVLILVGALAAGLIGRAFVNLGERFISKLPIIRSLYSALKQIFQTVLASSSKAFREVVLVEYPRKGIWAIAFITGPTKGEVAYSSKKKLVNIFLPTTPNPTSGFLLFVPKDDLIILNMNVEEGMKMVISGGIITPKYQKKQSKSTPVSTQRK